MEVLKGRTISRGRAAGEALVCDEPIGFNFGIDVDSGTVTEGGHSLFGQSIKDRILVFPHGKGSTGGSYVIYQLAKMKTGPRAILNAETETIIAVGAILGEIPVMDRFDRDVLREIKSGDMVDVDADKGAVTIEKR